MRTNPLLRNGPQIRKEGYEDLPIAGKREAGEVPKLPFSQSCRQNPYIFYILESIYTFFGKLRYGFLDSLFSYHKSDNSFLTPPARMNERQNPFLNIGLYIETALF
jgi:hypothetical protein